MTVKVALKDFPERLRERFYQSRKDMVTSIQVGLEMYGPLMFQREVDRAKPRPPVDRGTYRRSVRVDRTDRGAKFYNFSPHAVIIEKGRGRNKRMPPIKAIQGWVRRKGIASSRNAKSVAFAIAKSIAKRGLPPPPNGPMAIMAKTRKAVVPLIMQDLVKALKR